MIQWCRLELLAWCLAAKQWWSRKSGLTRTVFGIYSIQVAFTAMNLADEIDIWHSRIRGAVDFWYGWLEYLASVPMGYFFEFQRLHVEVWIDVLVATFTAIGYFLKRSFQIALKHSDRGMRRQLVFSLIVFILYLLFLHTSAIFVGPMSVGELRALQSLTLVLALSLFLVGTGICLFSGRRDELRIDIIDLLSFPLTALAYVLILGGISNALSSWLN